MAVINVPADQPTIQLAVDVASEGDTIRVAEGTFNEAIVIGVNKDRIRIIGAGIGKTIVDGTGLGAVSGIDIQASTLVTIEKLTVQNFEDTGILIQTSDNIVNQVKSLNNQNNGMEIDGQRNLIIESEASFNSSNVNSDVNGIEVNGDHNYIVKCKFIGNSNDGLDLESSNNLVFLNLAKENGSDGFDVNVGDDFNLFICNQAIRNNDDGFDVESDDNLFLWNKALCNEGDGIRSDDCNLVWGNEVKCNTEDGIDVNNNNRIIRNKVVKNGIPQENDRGIEIEDDGNIVDNNCVENNVNAGIFVRADTQEDNVIRSNRLRGNNPDIVDNGTDTVFDDNKCTTSDPDGLCQINNEVIVNEGESIQAAIDAATEGLTIRVSAGTFNEALTIGQDKNRIRIIGAGRRKTVIDGTGIVGAIGINIDQSNFITIENLTVQNFDIGIRINTSDNILHCVNVFGNQLAGIRIESGAERNMVMNCVSSGNGDEGISVDGDHNYIVCSQCNRNGAEGIFLNGEFNLALNNFCEGNHDEGIEPASDNNFIIGNCALNQSGGEDPDGIEADSDFNLFLWNKTCGNEGIGIDVEDKNNLVWGNVCSNNERDGIFVQDESNSNRIINNIVKNNKGEGIRIEDPSDFNIMDNNKIVKNNLAGILLENNTNNNAVRSNCLIGNTPDIKDEGMDNVIDENKCQTSIPDGLCEDC